VTFRSFGDHHGAEKSKIGRAEEYRSQTLRRPTARSTTCTRS